MGNPVGVIGAGGWGLALSKLLAEKGEEVTLWCHGSDSYRELCTTRQSRDYLPGITLPKNVALTQSLPDTVGGKALVLCVVPSHAVREVMSGCRASLDAETLLVCGSKGLDEERWQTMGEVFGVIFGAESKAREAFLSGPSFAAEVARGLPTAVTVAAYRDAVARRVQEVLSTPTFRVYTSTDVVGVQIGGVAKNVIAIAAGISDGLGLGYNARAALMTRGLSELTRLAVRLGADPMTVSGLAGLGDLILTCTGELSRNRSVGVQIARGKRLDEIVQGTRMVAEGIRNTRSVYLLAGQLGVEMPIVEQMYRVLYEGKTAEEAVRDLLQRSLKPERT